MILEAHRGVSNEYPENTLAAFRAAKKLGYGMIELDTKFTADNICVMLHDSSLNRTARLPDGSMLEKDTPIAGLTLSEAKKYDVGLMMGERFRGESVPTLTEVLRFAVSAPIPLKFDNVMWSHTKEQREILYTEIKNSGLECGFTCNSLSHIHELLEKMPDAAVHFDGAVSEETLAELSDLVRKEKLTVWMRFDNKITSWNKTPPVSAEYAEMVHKVGKLGVWLLTTKEELEKAISLGADIAETDGSLRP